ncbi:uncharacterized protein LOC144095423 [Amblyomma americanum]
MQTDVSAGAASATTGKNSERKWCKFCDKAFSNTSNLRKHVKNVHGEGALQHVKDEEALTMKVRSFSCDLCPKHFVILRDLRRHHVDEHNFEEEVENLVFDSNTGRLAEGVPAKTVVHNIRAGTSGSSPWMQLVTTKDLRNIADKFRIGKEEQRDSDDFKSVDLWVEEMRAENESPLLYYMKKGDPNSHDGDFELALHSHNESYFLNWGQRNCALTPPMAQISTNFN